LAYIRLKTTELRVCVQVFTACAETKEQHPIAQTDTNSRDYERQQNSVTSVFTGMQLIKISSDSRRVHAVNH
jgi:hypothetical protein